MQHIGDRLKEERKRLGLNQTQFATLGGVQLTAQVTYEKGTRYPDAKYLSSIAAGGVDVLYVLTGNRTPKGTDTLAEDAERLVDNYYKVDSVGKTAAQQLLSTLAEGKKRAA